MAEPVQTEYAPEPEEDDGSIVGKSIGFLGDALKGIPGVYPAYKAVMWSGEAFGGAGSATLRVGRDIIKEEGVGTFLKETAIEALPFKGSSEYTGRYHKILSIDEDDNLKERMNKARDWQRERDSAFWGEKFLSEVLFDPLTYVPIGTAIKGLKAIRPGARAARRLSRQAEVMRDVSRLGSAVPLSAKDAATELSLRGSGVPEGYAVHQFADVPAVQALKNSDFPTNNLGNLTRWTVRKSGVPFIHKAVNLINPSALIRAAIGLDKGAKVGVRHKRTQKLIDGITEMDIHALKALGKTQKVFDIEEVDGNLFVKNMLQRSDARPPAHRVPLSEVFEYPERYILDGGIIDGVQAQYIRVAGQMIEAWKARALAEGIPLSELTWLDGKHYFPRFVEMVSGMRRPKAGGAAGRSTKATVMEERIYEEVQDAMRNGVVYMGARSDDAVADIIMTYMKSIGRVISNQRLNNEVKAMGTTINDRIIGRKGGAGLLQAVRQGGKAKRQLDNAQEMVARVNTPRTGNVKLDAVTPTLTVYEVRFLRAALSTERSLVPHNVSRKFEEALLLPAGEERMKKLAEVRKVFSDAYELRANKLTEDTVDLADLRKQVESPWALVAMHDFPAAKGHLFDPEDVKQLLPFLSTTEQTLGAFAPALRMMSTISGISRTASLTFDFGAGLLQGAMVLTTAPKTWINATRRSIHAFVDPTVRHKYIKSKLDVLATYKNLHIGSTEMTEALQPGGAVSRVFGYVPGGRMPTQAAQRFATSFEMFFDVARIEMAEAFLPAVKAGRATADQVASHLNKMTGVLDSRALGVSSTQRELEAAAFTLAPRWFRSTVALFADGFQGAGKGSAGWEGTQARLAIGKFFGGTVMAYVAIATGLKQMGYDVEVKIDPRSKAQGGDGGEFMTFNIGGQNIGLGGKPYSMVRYLMKMATDPENQGFYAEQFLRGQSAPATSAMWDILSGETFIGEPVRSTSEIMREGIAPRFMPFYLESMLNDDPRPGWTALPAEAVGLRTYPSLPTERFGEIKDELAAYITNLTPDQERRMDDEGLESPTWEMLSQLQRHSIERDAVRTTGAMENPDIPSNMLNEFDVYDKRVEKWRSRKTDPNGVRAFMNELGDAREDLRIAGNKRQKEYDDAAAGPRKFLENMRIHQRDYGVAMDDINAPDGPNAKAIAYFKKKNADAEFIPLQDMVYAAYIEDLVQNPDLMDIYGNFDFEARDRKERALRAKYGDDIVNTIEKDIQSGKEMTPLWNRWLNDRELLKPYWELRDRYLKRNPSVRSIFRRIEKARNRRDTKEVRRLEQLPKYRRYEREIREQKLSLRENDPRLDGTLVFWEYASNVVSKEAYRYI